MGFAALVPATYFGSHVLAVAPSGQGARFSKIQDALDFANGLPVGEDVAVLLAPGYYDEDVVLRRDKVHFNGLAGGLGGIVVKSVCVSDCTLASIDAFRLASSADKGDFSKLTRDPAIHSIPRTVSFTNVRFGRRANSPAWHPGSDGAWDPSTSKYERDSALYSFSAIGAAVPNTTFLDDVLAIIGCVTDTATGATANAPNGYQFVRAGNPVFLNSLLGDGSECHNCGQVLVLNGIAFGPLVAFHDVTETAPAGASGNGYSLVKVAAMGGLYAIGADGNNAFAFDCTIQADLKTEATAAVSTFLFNSAVGGNLEIANLGPSVTMYMGRYSNPCAGAGAAGFTEFVGFGT